MNTVHAPLTVGHFSTEADGEGYAVFDAEGIHCTNCARSIRRALEALPGLRHIDINVVDLAWMGATFANMGTNPATREHAFDVEAAGRGDGDARGCEQRRAGEPGGESDPRDAAGERRA